MLLAARGVSIVVSSGDNGAAGTGYSSSGECTASTCSEGTGFYPSFPATCPYVTAVGGTSGPEMGEAEVSCQSDNCANTGSGSSSGRGGIITSGGGFSTYFPRPSWQDTAVETYLNSGVALPKEGTFNAKGRGIPDISGKCTYISYKREPLSHTLTSLHHNDQPTLHQPSQSSTQWS